MENKAPKPLTPGWYRDFGSYLKEIFGCRVHKISLDAGFSCPNRDGTLSQKGCIYCNEKGSGTGAWARGIPIAGQIEAARGFLEKRYKAKKFLAYFQSFSNTYAPVTRLEQVFEEALAQEKICGLCIGTRPDCVPDKVLSLLDGLNKKTFLMMEYGLQSACDRTLALINRGHDSRAFEETARKTTALGIRVCAHVILGLPGESRQDMQSTADFLASLGVDAVKIHLLYVIKGSSMEELYKEGGYKPLAMDAYVDLVCDFLERLPQKTVIERLTGDPHPQELAAPSWALGGKARILDAIRQRMVERETWQSRLVCANKSNQH